MTAFLRVLTIIGAIFGALTYVGTWAAAKSAPQEAAGAAMAIALAVIPYVLWRAVQSIADRRERHAYVERIAASLAVIERRLDKD